MNILFLTNLLPYPLDNGGKIKSYTTLQALKNDGHHIDLASFKETMNDMLEYESEILKVCRNVRQIYQRLTTAENKSYMMRLLFKSLILPLSFNTYKYQSKEMLKYLTGLREKYTYDCVYFDHLPMCVYLRAAKKLWPKAKFILDEHNCEALIMKRNAENTGSFVKKALLSLEAKKLTVFERTALQSVDRTIVLSSADYTALKELAGRDFPHMIIPIGVQDRGIRKERNNTELHILFIGTLTWEPNNQGLIWFLKEVVPLLKESAFDYKLYIVGKNPSDEVKNLTSDHPNMIVTGYVEAVDEYYDTCDCTIVPLFIGSGQRVKLIEAFSKGMPAVSTTIGAEGLHYEKGEDILIADTAEDFCKAIIKMRDPVIRDKIKLKSRRIYEKFYSPGAVTNMLVEAIK